MKKFKRHNYRLEGKHEVDVNSSVGNYRPEIKNGELNPIAKKIYQEFRRPEFGQEPQKRIKWNEVTWYSKALAMALFVALPFVAFYLGMQYQNVSSGIEIVGIAGNGQNINSGQNQQAVATTTTGNQQNNPTQLPTQQLVPTYTVSLQYPYAVSWQGINGATVSLTGASLGQTVLGTNGQGNTTYALTLTMNVQSGFGNFCTSAFSSYGLKMVLDESGNTESPTLLDNNCTPSNSSLTSQRVAFSVAPDKKELLVTIQNPDSSQQTFFTVNVLDNGSLRITPAATQG